MLDLEEYFYYFHADPKNIIQTIKAIDFLSKALVGSIILSYPLVQDICQEEDYLKSHLRLKFHTYVTIFIDILKTINS